MSTGTQHGQQQGSRRDTPMTGLAARLAIAWTVVGVPLAYGIYKTAEKASALFTG